MEEISDELRKATLAALRCGGLPVLRDPKRFTAFVSDVLGPDSPEIGVLYRTLDMTYLEKLADGGERGTAVAIRSAAEQAATQLEHELMMSGDTARRMMFSIAFGMSDYLGIDMEERVVREVNATWEEEQLQEDEERRRESEEKERQRLLRLAAEEQRQREAREQTRKNAVVPPAVNANPPAKQANNKKSSVAPVAVAALVIVALVIGLTVAANYLQAPQPIQPVTSEDDSNQLIVGEGEDVKSDDTTQTEPSDVVSQGDDTTEADSGKSEAPPADEEDGPHLLGPPFSDFDAMWWGGYTDTEDLVVYVEDLDGGIAAFMGSHPGGRLVFFTGTLEIDGDTTIIHTKDWETGEDDPFTMTITSRDDYSLTFAAPEDGSGVLPVLSQEQRQICYDALNNINNA